MDTDTDTDTAVNAGAPAAEQTPRPLRKDAARNHQLLLDAGRVVFAERGLDASLDDVAHHAGVGVGTAYRHFGNKHELARAIFAQAIDEVVQLAESTRSMPDPWQGIVAFAEGVAVRQTQDRGLREVLMGVHAHEDIEHINERLTAPLRELVTRAKGAGVLRQDVEATDIGIVVLMLCTVADTTGDVDPDQWRRYLPMLLDGLRHGAESPIAPLSEDALRIALASHKQRLFRPRAEL